jgi:hypothetical protein
MSDELKQRSKKFALRILKIGQMKLEGRRMKDERKVEK